MAAEFELLNPTDKPALLGITNPEMVATCKQTLEDLGYKVHGVALHTDFLTRFTQIPYQIVILEELFDGKVPEDNRSLIALRAMPMNQRRHAVSLLLGSSFQTLHPMQAFQQSVHAVVNPADFNRLSQILQKVVSDNDLFYAAFRDAQLRLTKGK